MSIKSRKSVVPLPQEIQPRILNARQSAAYLGCSLWCLRSLVWRGELRPIKIGDSRRLLLAKEDLDRYIDAQKRAA